jgi:hypothetical protein
LLGFELLRMKKGKSSSVLSAAAVVFQTPPPIFDRRGIEKNTAIKT